MTTSTTTAPLRTHWQALAPREQTLVLAAGGLIALALLFFNMRKHLRKADYPDLPTSAEVREQQARDAAQQGAGGDQR